MAPVQAPASTSSVAINIRMARELIRVAIAAGDAGRAPAAGGASLTSAPRTPRTTSDGEIEDELKRTVPIVIADPADAEVRLKAYLTHKLR